MGIFVQFLTPPTKSGGRSFRRRFPEHLRDITGWEHKVPLGSEGSPGFLSRYEAAASEYDTIAKAAQRKRDGRHDVLDRPLIAFLAEAHRVEALENDNTARWDAGEREMFKAVADDLSTHGVVSSWAGRERKRWAMKQQETIDWVLPHHLALRAAGDLEGIVEEWSEEALSLAEARGYVLDPSGEAFPLLCRALNDASIAALQIVRERLDGQDVPTPLEPAPPAPEAPAAPDVPRVPLVSTFDAYAAARGLTVGVRDKWRDAIKLLVAFVGHEDADLITAEDLRGWRDKLLTEPTKRGSPRSAKTVRGKYLAAVRALFTWAVQEGRLPANVAAEVTVHVAGKAKLRDRDFTAEETKAILSATLKSPSERLAPGHARARRWVPWLCAYTGARVNEVSQLRYEDVQQVDGIWTIRITPEAGTVKTKEARIVPLHEHLIEQGFLDAVEAHGPGPLFYDPSNQRVQKEGNRHFKKVGERLAGWVRKEVGITDPQVQPNHAWRHTFKTLSADLEIEERVADAIQGHSPKTTGRTYGKVSLKAKANAIAKLPRFEVPGV